MRTVETELFDYHPKKFMSIQETIFSMLSLPMLQELEELRYKTWKSPGSLEVSDPGQKVDMLDLARSKSSEPLMRNLISSIPNNALLPYLRICFYS